VPGQAVAVSRRVICTQEETVRPPIVCMEFLADGLPRWSALHCSAAGCVLNPTAADTSSWRVRIQCPDHAVFPTGLMCVGGGQTQCDPPIIPPVLRAVRSSESSGSTAALHSLPPVPSLPPTPLAEVGHEHSSPQL
jgi:hypothetical protein